MTANPIFETIRRMVLLREAQEQSDGQLLARFLGGEREALEMLVLRHAPMVWAVCRSTLAREQDANDAFQTTFLVLLRKVKTIHPPEQLADWLCGVAYKTARKARQTVAIRASRETPTPEMPDTPTEPSDDISGPEQRARLYEELNRLPEKYRTVIVLCELQGISLRDAAQQLGLPEGTVASRLWRGRKMLEQRLRHDLGSLALSLAAVPQGLLNRTIDAVGLMAEGQTVTTGLLSTEVPTLTATMLHSMAAKWKATAVLVLLAGLALGGGMAAYHLLEPRPDDDVKRYGSEAEARSLAERQARVLAGGSLAMVTMDTSHLRNVPASKRHKIVTLKAELDRKSGAWTVTGTGDALYIKIFPPDPGSFWPRSEIKIVETEWKMVVRCRPWPNARTGPGGLEVSDGGRLLNWESYGPNLAPDRPE
jgi:RNA polymerase sigma factor (sigma-70 family)